MDISNMEVSLKLDSSLDVYAFGGRVHSRGFSWLRPWVRIAWPSRPKSERRKGRFPQPGMEINFGY